MGILTRSLAATTMLGLGLVHCAPEADHQPCIQACQALAECGLLPSVFGASSDVFQNCVDRCSREEGSDDTNAGGTGGNGTGGDGSGGSPNSGGSGGALSSGGTGGAATGSTPAPLKGSLRERLLYCTQQAQGSGGGVSMGPGASGGTGGSDTGGGGEPAGPGGHGGLDGQGGLGGEGGHDRGPTTGAPSGGASTSSSGGNTGATYSWCNGTCVSGNCATVASCLSAHFLNPAARGTATAILLAVDESSSPGEFDDLGCWQSSEPAIMPSSLCTELGNPTVRVVGDLSGATGDQDDRPCADVLGKPVNLGTLPTGAYTPALDFWFAGRTCQRVIGIPQFAQANEEQVFRLAIPTKTVDGGARKLTSDVACATTQTGTSDQQVCSLEPGSPYASVGTGGMSN